MTTTIELAREAGLNDFGVGWQMDKMEAFRALIVAERDRELLAVDMEPIHEVWISTDSCGEHYNWEDVNDLDERQWKKVVKASHRYIYTAEQLASARLQGAEEERKKWQDNLHANVEYCPTCCEGKIASPDMTRDEVIFQCGKTSGRLQGAQRIAELEAALRQAR